MARIKIGGPSSRVSVGLRIFGDDLQPDEISLLLGCPPTKAYRKGDMQWRSQIIANTGKWLLDVENADKLEPVVWTLLEKLTPDPAVWSDLGSRYSVDLFCGVFFDDFNGGFGLSPKLMQALSERGLEIGFDIYFE
ncbi:MAG: DUF4279 domain-containing protein [Chloroflexota bacterium]